MHIMNAKKYNNIKLSVGISESVLTFVLILFFVSFKYSVFLENYIRTFVSNDYGVLALFTIISGAVLSVLFFPLKYYVEFHLEHKYNLSNQTFIKWIWEDLKGLIVGILIGMPILFIFYFSLTTFGGYWWLPFSLIMFVVSVLLAKIVPIVILPLFYKISPLENADLKTRIFALSSDVGMKVENIFSFNMSKNTKKANAAFTGLGKTKKIILGDTLLAEYTNDEIETVIAHELGHYKHKHIIKNIMISTVISFLMFFSIAVLFDVSLRWFGFNSRTEIASMPVLVLWSMLIGLILTPIGNVISRKFEYQADNYAVKSTGKKKDFIETLNKLTKQNLGDEEPHPLVEWFFYSHPSVKKRISYINSL